MCTVYFLWIYPDCIIIYQRSLIIKIRKVILLVRIEKWRVFCKESVTRNAFQLRSQTEHVLIQLHPDTQDPMISPTYSYGNTAITLWIKKNSGDEVVNQPLSRLWGSNTPTYNYTQFSIHTENIIEKDIGKWAVFSFLLFQWLSLWHETQTFQAFSSSCHWLLCQRRKVTHIIYKIMVIQPVDIKILYNTVITHFFSVDDENCISNICRVGLLFVQ